MQTEKIEILEHTADLSVRINAADEKELLELGADAVYQLLGQPVSSDLEPKPYPITLQANNYEELLHDWLAEVLYWTQVRQILFDRYEFQTLRPTTIKATAWGRKMDVEKSNIHIEIKAVTYHNLKIEQTPNGLTATVIFDI